MKRAALLAILIAAAVVLPGCGGRYAPPVVLISIDTLRADHLPSYGYEGVETPNLDQLARDSVVFENAYSQVPLTLPSHAVILTGKPPYEIGVRDNVGFRLGPSIPTLATYLKDNGYATGAAVSSLALALERGLDRGFDLYDDVFAKDSPDERAGAASAAVLQKWLDTIAEKPPFLFLHMYEPHAPYAPPEPFQARYAAHPYDGEIAAADAAVGGFVAAQKRRGLYDRAVVIFLADHGEGLDDHGEPAHGVFLYREAIHVPLFVKLPGRLRAGERVVRPVGLTDVFPTVAALVRRPAPAGMAGIDLLAPATPETSARRIYSESLYPRLALGWSELYSLADARYQYIEAPRPEFYDMTSDPGEKRDLAGQMPGPFRSMRIELGRIPRVEAAPERATAEELEKLGSLGYISVNRGVTGKDLPDPKDRIASLRKYKQLFDFYYARKDAEVVSISTEILKEEPSMISVWSMRATSRARLGDVRGAVDDIETGLANCPNAVAELHSQMIEQLAINLEKLGDRKKAETVLRAGLAGPLATDAMRVNLAAILTETGRAEEAAKILPPESPTEDAAVADARGVAAAEAGRIDEARRHFQAALAQKPDDAKILLHLGMLSLREKDPATARGWFEKALASKPDAPGTLSALGLAQAQLNDQSGAYASWTRALKLDPAQYDTLFNLAMLSGRMGRIDEARRALERFVASAPPDRYAGQISQARQALRSLPSGKG
ncbi:MAG TPA: sulfatase-like hydrolase/transferase [Thermoanaerobaculia bacterium]